MSRRELEAQVIRETLSEHEQTLLRLAAHSGPARIKHLYSRQYGSLQAVEAALGDIRQKVERALTRHHQAEQPLATALAGLTDDQDDDNQGIPIRHGPRASAPASTVNGAAAGPRAGSDPPARQPPPSKELPTMPDSPAAATDDARNHNQIVGAAREQAILERLAKGPAVRGEIAEAIGVDAKPLGKALARLKAQGKIRPGARREGMRGDVREYELVDGLQPAAPAPAPAPAKAPAAAREDTLTPHEPLPPAPRPFAGEPSDNGIHIGRVGAMPGTGLFLGASSTYAQVRNRYAHVLIDHLEKTVEEGDVGALMDRIERVLGIDRDAEHPHRPLGAGELRQVPAGQAG